VANPSYSIQQRLIPDIRRWRLDKWGASQLLLAAILAVPLLAIIGSFAFPRPDTWRHLADTVLADYIVNSLILIAGVGVGTLILALVPAWLVTMSRFPGSRTLEWALLLPLAMPAYIIAYSYTGMLDVAGPVQTFIRDSFGFGYGDYWFPSIRTLGGAIVMLSLVLYPYVYLLARTAFIEQSICVLEISRTFGHGPVQRFCSVALPLARPAIVAGLSLALMEALADYGTVQYFGVAVFTTGIFRTWFGLGDSIAAAQLSALLLVVVIALLWIERRSRREARYFHTSSRYSDLAAQSLHGWRAALACLVCVMPVAIGFLLPAGYLAWLASDTLVETLGSDFWRLLRNSLGLAAITALLGLALALFLTYGKRLHDSRWTRTVPRFLSLGYAVPGTVIAVGALLPFAWLDNWLDGQMRDWFGVSTGLLLSGTLFVLVYAYLVRFLAVAINTTEAGLAKIRPSMDEAGRSMGLGRLEILRRIHMPMMHGTLMAAVLLVFVDVLKELPATLLLRPFNFNTLAVRTFELANEERLADAAGPALAIVLVGIIPVILLSRIISRSRPGHDS
jgi:iron(III) transport system permease protein